MKIISFSAVEILPALLNKTKQQTIRPAWYKIEKLPLMNGGKVEKVIPFPIPELPKQVEKEAVKNFKKRIEKTQKKIDSIIKAGGFKPTRFKVGEKVQICWKSRGMPKYAVFCSVCGEEFPKASTVCRIADSHHKHKRPLIVFPKLLGTATITEVFQIEMGAEPTGIRKVRFLDGRNESANSVGDYLKPVKELAERDGFGSILEMMIYFNKKYGIYDAPKKFHVYRWKWLE